MPSISKINPNGGATTYDLKDSAASDSITKIYAGLAPEYSIYTEYSAGDVVIYNGELYKNIQDPGQVEPEGSFNPLYWTKIASAQECQKVANTITVNDFSMLEEYAVGDIVRENDKLYRFKVAHAWQTPWNSSEVERVDVVGLIDEVNGKVGDVSTLATTAKTSTVAAINEVNEKTDYTASRRFSNLSTEGWYTIGRLITVSISDARAWTAKINAVQSFDYANSNVVTAECAITYRKAVFTIVNSSIPESHFTQIRAVKHKDHEDTIYIQIYYASNTYNFVSVQISAICGTSGYSYYAENYMLNTISDNDLVVLGQTAIVNNSINDRIDSINAYLGLYNDSDIIGCKHDTVNYTHTRMANAVGKSAGSDFNVFPMYGGSYRCNLSYAGVELARYGDSNYTENGSNGHCMVFRPKFYYRRVPLVLEPLSTGYGYLMRKWIDYISYYPKPGFKLHPAFIGENGQEIAGYYISTYEGSLYDVSASAYILDDAQVADFSADMLCSIANAKPISGTSQQLTRANAEILAKNCGTGWHTLTLPILAAEQMLFSIEYATFNSQQAIGRGVVDASAPVATGQTSSLGNASGMASGTDGLVSVSYRGYENPWGNIWKFVNGINVWGDGSMGGGMPYICDDFNFANEKKTDNYKSAGFTLASPIGGYISAFGYSEDYDWLYLPSETLGNSDTPISDWFETQDSLEYRTIISGGAHPNSAVAGIYAMSTQEYDIGLSVISARLVYIPEK